MICIAIVSGLIEMPLTFRQYDYSEYYPQLQSQKSSWYDNWLTAFHIMSGYFSLQYNGEIFCLNTAGKYCSIIVIVVYCSYSFKSVLSQWNMCKLHYNWHKTCIVVIAYFVHFYGFNGHSTSWWLWTARVLQCWWFFGGWHPCYQ